MKFSALRSPEFALKNAAATTELSTVTGIYMTQHNFGTRLCKDTYRPNVVSFLRNVYVILVMQQDSS
jgi:hypothetical protein